MYTRNEGRLSENERLFLEAVYRQAKITGFVQLNFLLPKLGLCEIDARLTLAQLEAQELLKAEKYGILRLTEKGKAYLQCAAKSATLSVGE